MYRPPKSPRVGAGASIGVGCILSQDVWTRTSMSGCRWAASVALYNLLPKTTYFPQFPVLRLCVKATQTTTPWRNLEKWPNWRSVFGRDEGRPDLNGVYATTGSVVPPPLPCSTRLDPGQYALHWSNLSGTKIATLQFQVKICSATTKVDGASPFDRSRRHLVSHRQTRFG